MDARTLGITYAAPDDVAVVDTVVVSVELGDAIAEGAPEAVLACVADKHADGVALSVS